MKTRFNQFVWAVCISIGAQYSAWPQSSLYFDRSSFLDAQQAVPGIHQSISFSGGLFGPTLTISDVTFTGRYLGTHGLASGIALYNFDSGVPLGIHFANGARAFGGDFSSLLSPLYSSFTATLSLANGESFQFTAPTDPNSTFFGFISPTPVTDVTFSDGGLFHLPTVDLHEELIGNLFMVLEVPEPHTLGFFALGALLLGWRLPRMRKP